MKPLIVLAALFAHAFVPAAFAQDSVDWLSDYREALTVAKAANKPILLEFRCEA